MYKLKVKDSSFLPHCACDVEIILQQAEVLVLTGENGIGKTTLMHRCYESYQGKEAALIEQKSMDIFFDRRLGKLKKIFLSSQLSLMNDSRFEELWKSFHLHAKEDRLISQLSGGESQCLKLCLALSKEAQLYFLDEPSQYLDHERKQVLAQALEKLRVNGKTIMMVEHDEGWLISGWKVQRLKVQENNLIPDQMWTI